MSVQFKSELLQLANSADKRASSALARTARRVGQIAENNAPVRSGALKRSKVVEIAYLVAYIGFTAPYAGYVNYGTRFQTANPFFTMAFLQAEEIFKQELVAEFRR